MFKFFHLFYKKYFFIFLTWVETFSFSFFIFPSISGHYLHNEMNLRSIFLDFIFWLSYCSCSINLYKKNKFFSLNTWWYFWKGRILIWSKYSFLLYVIWLDHQPDFRIHIKNKEIILFSCDIFDSSEHKNEILIDC